MIDVTEQTQDEAIGVAVHMSEPGDLLIIHAPGCACVDVELEDVDAACDCTPTHYIVPPRGRA